MCQIAKFFPVFIECYIIKSQALWNFIPCNFHNDPMRLILLLYCCLHFVNGDTDSEKLTNLFKVAHLCMWV